jgi:hypothetical protein
LLYSISLYGIAKDLPEHLLKILGCAQNPFGFNFPQYNQYLGGLDVFDSQVAEEWKQIELVHANPLLAVCFAPGLGFQFVELSGH